MNIYNRLQLSPRHLSSQHLSLGHLSISSISQLLLAQIGSNFKQRVLWRSTTDYNFHHDVCPGNICCWEICPYQQYNSFQAEHFRLQSCFTTFQKNLHYLIAAPRNGVKFRQKSIGAIRCSLAMMYENTWGSVTPDTLFFFIRNQPYGG